MLEILVNRFTPSLPIMIEKNLSSVAHGSQRLLEAKRDGLVEHSTDYERRYAADYLSAYSLALKTEEVKKVRTAFNDMRDILKTKAWYRAETIAYPGKTLVGACFWSALGLAGLASLYELDSAKLYGFTAITSFAAHVGVSILWGSIDDVRVDVINNASDDVWKEGVRRIRGGV